METTNDTNQSSMDDELFRIIQERQRAKREGTLESYNRKAELSAMETKEYAILTSMAAGIGESDGNKLVDMTYTRLQSIMLMFFIDREMGEIAGFKFFDFSCENDAFGKDVTDAIVTLSRQGLIKEHGNSGSAYYELTRNGYHKGREILARISSEFSEYFKETANWVKSNTSEDILRTSHVLYPELKSIVSNDKSVDIRFENQCKLVLDRIMHRRRQLIEHFGENDE